MSPPGFGQRVAVIGAGYAGMAAASELAARGVPTTVFEAASVPGGRARVVRRHGVALDNGQHLLVGAYGETLRLMRLVGADSGRLLARAPFGLTYAGPGGHMTAAIAAPGAAVSLASLLKRFALLPAGFSLASALLCARGLKLADKLAARRLMAGLRARAFRLECDTTVAAFLAAQEQPDQLCRFLWRPLCLAALNTPPDAASAQVFANVLRDALAGDAAASELLMPRVDLSALFPEPAVRYVKERGGEVLLGMAVRQIDDTGRGYRLETAADSHGPFSHVIVATAPRQQQALCARLPGLAALGRDTAALSFEPIATCYLAYPAATRLARPMLGLTGGVAQWLFDRGQCGGPPGLIAAVVSAGGDHLRLSRAELASVVHEEIAAIVPGLPQPAWSEVIREQRATFACLPAMRRPQSETALPGLLLAGDYVAGDYPATLEAAVQSGVKAASLVVDAAAG